MKYVRLFTDLRKALEPFSPAEKGRLLDAILRYADEETEPDFCGNERFIWPTIRSDIDRQIEAYLHQCEVNRANITNRYEPLRTVANGNEPKQDKDKEKTKDKDKDVKSKPPARFTPPTVEEVKAYCAERHNTVNPERFMAFYEANGWVQGKGKPIKDWKAAVRTWEDEKPYKDGEPKKSKYANVPVS